MYAAAGGTGVGVLQTAADEGALSIGVDSNQNYLHPGSVLTSMLKRVDNAVYDSFMAGEEGTLEPGVAVLDLLSEGVGYAVDENNEALLTDEMRTAVEEARQKIIDGEIEVHDYTTDNACPRTLARRPGRETGRPRTAPARQRGGVPWTDAGC